MSQMPPPPPPGQGPGPHQPDFGQQPPPPGGMAYGGVPGQPSQPRKRTNPLVFVIPALAVVAIGVLAYVVISNDEDGLREQYVDALASGWASTEAEDVGLLEDRSDDEVHCLAGVTVDVAGVDRLAEHYTPDELRDMAHEDPNFELDLGDDPTREQAEEIVDGMDRCIGYFEELRSAVVSDPELSPDAATCITQALDDSLLRESLIDEIMEVPGASLGRTVAEQVSGECGHLNR